MNAYVYRKTQQCSVPTLLLSCICDPYQINNMLKRAYIHNDLGLAILFNDFNCQSTKSFKNGSNAFRSLMVNLKGRCLAGPILNVRTIVVAFRCIFHDMNITVSCMSKCAFCKQTSRQDLFLNTVIISLDY